MYLLRKLPDLLLPSSLRELFQTTTDLLQLVLAGLRRLQQPSGLYEVLSYRAQMEVLDSRGDRAIYERKEHVRFLRNHVSSWFDYSWGSGEPFASHRVWPGRIAERRQIGPRYRSLVVLPQPKQKGEEVTFRVRRTIKRGLTGHRNWLEAEVNHPMRRLELTVILPAVRPVHAARLIEHRQVVESVVAVQMLAGGKQRLAAQVVLPAAGNLYTLEWDW